MVLAAENSTSNIKDGAEIRRIIHVDMDCFFAAVEMRDRPELTHVPMAVGGRPESRGVISTANYPARSKGVHSALASQIALRRCPNLVLLPHRIDAYRHESRQIRAIFAAHTDKVEPLSLDEAFLDVSEQCAQRGIAATALAQQIQNEIYATTGLTASAGVSCNKFIAKVASDWRKPSGLTVVAPGEVAAFVFALPVAKIPGVGAKTAERLHKAGAQTCGQLQMWSFERLSQTFGRFGAQLYARCRGLDDRPVEEREYAKSLSVEHTFAADLGLPVAIEHHGQELLAELEERLAARGLNVDEKEDKPEVGSIVGLTVKVKFADFSLRSSSSRREPHHRTLERFVALWRAVGARRPAEQVRLLGLGVQLHAPMSESLVCRSAGDIEKSGTQLELFLNCTE